MPSTAAKPAFRAFLEWIPVACPASQTPLYVRRPPPGSIRCDPVRHGAMASLKALIDRGCQDCAKRQCRDPTGRDKAGSFAPFVYRLGRHPFTVERAVRF